jgi:PadR family transcriptional regulator PadR
VLYTTSYYEVVGDTMKYGRELLKGSTDHLLLSLLEQEPMYGYQLIKEIGKRSGGYFQFKESTLYPALHRLEREGLIRGKWQRLPSGLERRYYYLTESGRRVLNAKRDEWLGFSAAVNLVIEPVKVNGRIEG